MNHLILTLGIFCLVLISCDRDGTDPAKVNSQFYITLENPHDTALNFAFYRTKEDYIFNRNCLIRQRIAAHEKETINFDVALEDYLYFDIYTDKYSFSNWALSAESFRVPSAGVQNTTLAYSIVFMDRRRMHFIDSNKHRTEWHAIDAAYVPNTSIWAGLTENERFHKLTLSKDGQFGYETRTSAGTQKLEYGTFYTSHEGNYITMACNTGNYSAYIAPKPFSIKLSVADTIVFSDGNVDILMVQDL
jgi:hypothetical protein